MLAIEDEITQRIQQAFPQAEIRLSDMTGTRDHWEAVIISDLFEGQRLIQRQQGVYRALGELMAGPIHAFTMQTLTMSQAQEKGLLTPVSNPAMLVNIEEP
jgi:stress-induced morphogen